MCVRVCLPQPLEDAAVPSQSFTRDLLSSSLGQSPTLLMSPAPPSSSAASAPQGAPLISYVGYVFSDPVCPSLSPLHGTHSWWIFLV